MVKKLTLLMSIFLSTICLLAGCGNPYARMSLDISEKEIVLYIDRKEDGQIETTSQTIDITVKGAKKGVSTDIVVENSIENIVSITTQKQDNTTSVTFTPSSQYIGGSADLVVRTKEGNISDVLHVTVFDKVKDIAFSPISYAVSVGGTVNLASYLTYQPSGTNQKDVLYSIAQFEQNPALHTYLSISDTGVISADENILKEAQDMLSYDADKGLYYVTVLVTSQYDETITCEQNEYIINTIKAQDVVVKSFSDQAEVVLTGTLQDLDLTYGTEQYTLENVPTYQVVLASNINTQMEYLYSRTIEFVLSEESAKIDSLYRMSLVQQKYLQNDDSFIKVTELARNTTPNEEYEYHTYRIDQIKNGHDTLLFKIDYITFEGMLTTYVALDVTVQNIATDIQASVKGESISTIHDNPNLAGYRTINVLNMLGDNLYQTTNVNIVTNYDKTNKNIPLYFNLVATEEVTNDVLNLVKSKIFICDKNGNQIPLDGTGYINNGDSFYIFHELSASDVQTVRDKFALVVKTVYDLNPVQGEEMNFPHQVEQTFPLTIHTNVSKEEIEVREELLVSLASYEELILLDAGIGVYTSNFTITSDQRNTKVEKIASQEGLIESRVLVDDKVLFYVYQKDGSVGENNYITVVANRDMYSGQTYLILNDDVHNWQFRVKVIVYAPLMYGELEEKTYFASSIPNEDYYKGQWIAVEKENINITFTAEDTRTYSSITSLKLATTSARDKNTIQEYVPIEVYNLVKVGEQIETINLLSMATVSYDRSYMYYEEGRIYPFNKQYTNEEKPLVLSFTVKGYDSNGQEIVLTYSIDILIVDIVQSFDVTTTKDVLYENSSLGAFDKAYSQDTIQLICYPHFVTGMTQVFAYQDAVVRSFVVGGTRVDITVSDLMTLDPNTGLLTVDYTKTAYGKSKVEQLLTLFGSENNVIQNIYQSPISVKIEGFIKQDSLDQLYASSYITLDYATKVDTIIVSGIDEQGVYLEMVDGNASSTYASKTISFSVMPTSALNKNLRIVVAEGTDIIRFADGQVDQNGRIQSVGNTLTFYPVKAGLIELKIGAEDSFEASSSVVGRYEPSTYITIRVKVADGSKAYPFEIANTQDFFNIANGYKMVSDVLTNEYHYMLAKNINLAGQVFTQHSLFGGVFNGSLTGLMQYTEDSAVQRSIYGYKVVSDTQQTRPYYGMFEQVGIDGILDHIVLTQTDVQYKTEQAETLYAGILVGKLDGKITQSYVSGKLFVENTTDKDTFVGGVVGLHSGYSAGDSVDQSTQSNNTNYSVSIAVTAPKAYVGGWAGSVQGQEESTHLSMIEGVNGFASIVVNPVKDTTSMSMAGGLAGVVLDATIGNAIIQPVIQADVVGGMAGATYNTQMDHITVELLDMADTNATYGLYGRKVTGGMIGLMDASTITFSYVRSYAKTNQIEQNGQTVSYIGDLVLDVDGQYLGGLVGSHEDAQNWADQYNFTLSTKNVITNIQQSYVDVSIRVYATNDPKVGSLLGSSYYYVDESYTENNTFLQYNYAKITTVEGVDVDNLTFVGNYKTTNQMVTIHKMKIVDTSVVVETQLTIDVISTDGNNTILTGQQVTGYTLPDTFADSVYNVASGLVEYYGASEKLNDVRQVTGRLTQEQAYIQKGSLTGEDTDSWYIRMQNLGNSELGYYLYEKDNTYFAIPSVVTIQDALYQITLDTSYEPVDVPLYAYVAEDVEGSAQYVDGMHTMYQYTKQNNTTIVLDAEGLMMTEMGIPSSMDSVWNTNSASRVLAYRENVLDSDTQTIDWTLLSQYIFYQNNNVSSGYILNDDLPVLVDQTNQKLLYNILPTSLIIQVSETVTDITSNHYFIKDDDTAIMYYNVLIDGPELDHNNVYYVGLQQLANQTVATYTLDVNQDFGGDNRVSVMSSNPNVVQVQEGTNAIVLCGIGQSEITVRSLLDASVYDTFTIVTTYGIRGIHLTDAEGNVITNQDTMVQYISEYYSYYHVATTNQVQQNGIVSYYQTEQNFQLQVTITGYTNTDTQSPAMDFGGKKITVQDGVILVDGQNQNTFLLSNVDQIAIKGMQIGQFSFSITPLILVNGKSYTLTGVTQSYAIDIANQATSIVFDKGATSTTFAIAGSGSSSELGVYLTTYHEADELSMNVYDYQGNVLNSEPIALSTFSSGTYRYLKINQINQDVLSTDSSSEIEKYHQLQLLFDQTAYLSNILSTLPEDSLNHQQYVLEFVCESNTDLIGTFHVNMQALSVSSIANYYYPSAQQKDQQYYPQENASTYLVPGRIGMFKTNVFPMLNNVDYFTMTVDPAYRQYIRLTQYYANMNTDGTAIANYTAYENTAYLPEFAGIQLEKLSQKTYSANSFAYSYTGDYYIGVTTSSDCPSGGQVVFTLTGYRYTADGSVEIVTDATTTISLDVVALPKVDLTIGGEKESILANGYEKQMNVSISNYDLINDGPVEFVIEVEEGGIWTSEGVQSKYMVTESYLFSILDGKVGDRVRVTAHIEKMLNGVMEESNSSVIFNVVAYEITNIFIQSYPSDQIELLNGTQNYLLGDFAYRGETNPTIVSNLRLLRYTWNGILSSSTGSRNNPFQYYDNGYVSVATQQENYLYNGSIRFMRSNTNNYLFVETAKVSTPLQFRIVLSYYYVNGVPTLYTNQVGVDQYYQLYYDFTITIKDNSSADKPFPIYEEEDFYALEGVTEGHYILMNNLELTGHTPFALQVDSLDGNNHKITLNGFDLNTYQSGSTANVGLFQSIDSETVLKNLIIDIHPLMTNLTTIQQVLGKVSTTPEQYENALSQVKLNFSGIQTVNFGLVAVTNNGTITNVNVVNISEETDKEYLFVYTSQDYLSGVRTNASVAGLVYSNGSNGVITNSFVGMNYSTKNDADTSIQNTITVNMAQYGEITNDTSSTATGSDTNGQIVEEKQKIRPFVLAGGKELSGLVIDNLGTIASTYVYGVGLLNLASLFNEVYTAGVVLYNRGTVFASFVEGMSTLTSTTETISTLPSTNIYRANKDYIIESTGMSGGFVYQNVGTIYDCYANIAVSTNSGRTGDFVFQNQGSIRNCYTTAISLENSKGSGAPADEIRTNHGVFTGIGTDLTINNTGTYSGCYYLLLKNETESKIEDAFGIKGYVTGQDSQQTKSDYLNIDSYYGYSMGTNGSDYIWVMDTTGPKLAYSYTATTSMRYMNVSTSSSENGWNYIYFAAYSYGTTNNPILITSGEELVTSVINYANTIYVLPDGSVSGQQPTDESATLTPIFGYDNGGASKEEESASFSARSIRLVRSITISSTLINQTRINNRYLREVIFAGILDGNGMTVTIDNLNDELHQVSKENFGLFSQIGVFSSSNKAIVKNITFDLKGNVTSSNAHNVGMLAGSIYDATIIDVTVVGSEGVTISGLNAVGGIAGVIGGDSQLLNVRSSISVNSVYDTRITDKENSSDPDYDFAYHRYVEGDGKIDSTNVSYAGGIAGILDIDTLKQLLTYKDGKLAGVDLNLDSTDRTSMFITEQSSAKIMNLTVYGYVQIVAEHAGGLFGYVGTTSHVKHSTFEIDVETTQNIIGHNFAGGIVAENRGYLEEVYVDANAEDKEELDATLPSVSYGTTLFVDTNNQYPVAIGGIAGYNQGAIYNSYSKANVVNSTAFVAGGVIGIAEGVNYLSHVYTTAYAYARKVIGGVIGFVRENGSIQPTLIMDYVTGYNVWDNVTDKTTNNTTYTLLYNMYKEGYKDIETGKYSNFEVRMPQIGNQEYVVYDIEGGTTTRTLASSTYIGSLLGRVGRVSEDNVVPSVTASSMKDILYTRTNLPATESTTGTTIQSEENVLDTDEITTEIFTSNYATDEMTIYTSTSNYAYVNSMPNEKSKVSNNTDKIYFEDVYGIQKQYETLKNGLEFSLSTENGQYIKDEDVKNYLVLNQMASTLWVFDSISDGSRINSKYWSYDNVTKLPIMIEGVYSSNNIIENNTQYKSLLLQAAINNQTANKFYFVTKDITISDFVENAYDRRPIVFQGQLSGLLNENNNNKNTITLSKDATFNLIQNATIENLKFVVDLTQEKESLALTEYTNAHIAHGLFADYVYNSAIRNVDIEIKLPSSFSIGGQQDKVHEYLGLVFGYVVDSTIENVNITITNASTITGVQYSNFGVFAGGIRSSKVNTITVTSNVLTIAPDEYIDSSASGYSYGTDVTVGSFAGLVYTQSSLNNIQENVSLQVQPIVNNSSYRYYYIGSVAKVQNTTMSNYSVSGDITVTSATWITEGYVYYGRVAGYSSDTSINFTVSTTANLTYNPQGSEDTLYLGGVLGYASATTLRMDKEDELVDNIKQNIEVLESTKSIMIYAGGITGYSVKGNIQNIGVTSVLTLASTSSVYAGGITGYSKGVSMQNILFDGTITVGQEGVSSTQAYLGGLSAIEENNTVTSFVVMGTLQYIGTGNTYRMAGLAVTMNGEASAAKYSNGMVSPIFNTFNTLCKDGSIEPLYISCTATNRVDNTVKYPYELYLYEGMEDLGDISQSHTDHNGMRYVDFINTYYKSTIATTTTTTTNPSYIGKTFTVTMDQEGTRYNPTVITTNMTIGKDSNKYYLVDGAYAITLLETFNGVLIGKNTQDNVAYSSSSNLTNNGIIANIRFDASMIFTSNTGVLFNILVEQNEVDGKGQSSKGILTNENTGYIIDSGVVLDQVTTEGRDKIALLVYTNSGTIMNSYVVGNAFPSNAYALVANNTGRVLNSYYAGNVNSIISGGNYSNIKVNADAMGVPSGRTENNIQYLSTENLLNLGNSNHNFDTKTSLAYNNGYPYILGGMRYANTSYNNGEYVIYNQADWILTNHDLTGKETLQKVTITLQQNITLSVDIQPMNLKGSDTATITVDGNEKTITINSTMTASNGTWGLFGLVQNATITDLTVQWNKDRTLSSNNGITYAGGLIGQAEKVTLENVTVSNLTINDASTQYLGGVIGYGTNITIDKPVSVNNITLTQNNTASSLGAFAGEITNLDGEESITITNPTLKGNNIVGGAIGTITGDVSQVIQVTDGGSIQGGVSSIVGGVFGVWNNAQGEAQLENEVEVTTSSMYYVGGIVGQLKANNYTIHNWTFTNSISSTDKADLGGLIGYAEGNIVVKTVSVSDTQYTYTTKGKLGGLIGYVKGDVDIREKLNLSMQFDSVSDSLGGLVGVIDGDLTIGLGLNSCDITIQNDLSSTNMVGGLVAKSNGLSILSNNTTITLPSSIKTSGDYAGGLVGEIDGAVRITRSAFTLPTLSTIESKIYAGGLIGYLNSSTATINSIIYSVSANLTIHTTQDDAYVGGLVGYVGAADTTLSLGVNQLVVSIANRKAQYAGGLIGFIERDVIIEAVNLTIDQLLGVNAGGLIGSSKNKITITDNVTVTMLGKYTNYKYFGGLVGYNGESTTINVDAVCTVTGLSLTSNTSCGAAGFGYVGVLTNRGTIKITNSSMQTSAIYNGLVVGSTPDSLGGYMIIENSKLQMAQKTDYVGLIAGKCKQISATAIIELVNSNLIVPNMDPSTGFNFEKQRTNQELVNLIKNSKGFTSFGNLYIQNTRNEWFNASNRSSAWYGKYSFDTKLYTDQFSQFPYSMASGLDDSIVVATTMNFNTVTDPNTVTIRDYFSKFNITEKDSNFNVFNSYEYRFGLVTGQGPINTSHITLMNSKIQNEEEEKVLIGQFMKMMFAYIESGFSARQKWLVMDYHYYLDEQQLTTTSYCFIDDIESTKRDHISRIEIIYGYSSVAMGDNEKPNDGDTHTFGNVTTIDDSYIPEGGNFVDNVFKFQYRINSYVRYGFLTQFCINSNGDDRFTLSPVQS